MSNLNLNEQAQEILRIAQKYGVESNFFFITTFERYMQLMKYMSELKEVITKEGTTVQKSYSKGVANTYVHPALSAYTKTSAEANKTLQTLMKVIREMRNRESNNEPDPLLEFISGRKTTIE
jgi:hypothetical protein